MLSATTLRTGGRAAKSGPCTRCTCILNVGKPVGRRLVPRTRLLILLVGVLPLMAGGRAAAQSLSADRSAAPHSVVRYDNRGLWRLNRIEPNRITRPADGHTPRGALWRSAVIPGWGQIYNKQYVKLPFVYAALGGLVFAVIELDNEYDLYRRAFQYKAFQELVVAGQIEKNPKAGFQDAYEEVSSRVGAVSSRPLEIKRNNLRRGRDLSAIGLGLVYGLAMLDAYVSAHLLEFDVGEDLTFNVTPIQSGVRISTRWSVGRADR